MNRLPIIGAAACLALTIVLQQPFGARRASAADHPAAHARTNAAAHETPVRMTRRSWRGIALEVPSGWLPAAQTSDHATWASADHRQTVTIGAALDEHRGLALLVRSAAPSIASAAPGGRVADVRGLGADAAAVRVAASAHLRLEQTWTRLPGTGLVAIVSWTDSSGAWPRWARTHLPEIG